MDRMSPLDAAFLELEDADPHASLAIASIAVFEGPTPSHDEFSKAIAGRLPLVARYRQKVRRVPFDLGLPVWVDDPHFELSYHIRNARLPAPGGEEQLLCLMERIMAERLDRSRPLWEYWLIEGLEGGKWAVVSKVHHSMVDGIAGTDLYRVVMDPTPHPRPALDDHWTPAPEPTTASLTADALRELVREPLLQARALRRALQTPRRFAGRLAETARGLAALGLAIIPATSSSLSGPVGQQRRYRVVRTRLADLAAVGEAVGATVNDVVLASIAGGFRDLLISRGEQPAQHAVRSLVPVSVRARGDEGIQDNRVSLVLAYLPVDVAAPDERLRAMHAHLAALKASREAEAGEAMTSLARYEPFPLLALGERLVFKLPQRTIITVTTNVPGPKHPVYALGRRAVEILPYVPIATRLRFGIAIFSYAGAVTIGITGDRETTADIDHLAKAIEASIADYTGTIRPEPGPARAAPRRRTRQPAS